MFGLTLAPCTSGDDSPSSAVGVAIPQITGNQPQFFSFCIFLEVSKTTKTNTNPALKSLRSGHFVFLFDWLFLFVFQ
jgi:hypothetical protein